MEISLLIEKITLTGKSRERRNRVTEFAEKLQDSIYDMTDEWYGIHAASNPEGGKPTADDAAWRSLRMASDAVLQLELIGRKLTPEQAAHARIGDVLGECANDQQATNRETLENLRNADTTRERIREIRDWGRETKENARECWDRIGDAIDHIFDA